MNALEKLDVIILDNDHEACEVFATIVRRFYTWGEIYSFTDADEAIKFCLKQDIGVAIFIVDVFLGGVSGFSFLDSIEEKFPTCHSDAIIYTGNVSDDVVNICIASDINHLLQKPMKPHALQLAVRAIAERYLKFAKTLLLDPDFDRLLTETAFSTSKDKIYNWPESLDIIILDDEPLICETTATIVRRFYTWGEIYSFSNANEAIKFCLKRDIGVAIFIVDVFLGGVSGFSFLDSIEEKFPTCHSDAIIYTGNVSDDVVNMCIASDINHLLQKPIEPHALQLAVRAIAERYLKFAKTLLLDPDFARLLTETAFSDSTEQIKSENIETKTRAKTNIVYPTEKKLQTLLYKIDSLSRLIDKLSSLLKNKSLKHKLEKTKISVDYCFMLTGLLAQMFFVPALNVTKFNLNETINDVFSVLSDNARYQFHQLRHIDCLINSDEDLLRQVFFVFFKHINDYFFGEDGYLEAQTGIIKKSPHDSEHEIFYVEFRYKITETRLNSKDKDRILIVDDDIDVLNTLEQSFLRNGFNVNKASSGFECLDFLHENSVDLIILDIGMTGMNGNEVLETMRKIGKYRNVPVLLYSGNILEQEIDNFMMDYAKFSPIRALPKPTSPQKLIAVCREFLNQQSIEQRGLKDFFNYNIVESIQNDSILRMGFYPIMKISELLHLNIKIDESSSLKSILIEIKSPPLIQPKQTDSLSRRSSIEYIDYESLGLLNSNFRHDIKNKIYLVYGDILEIQEKHLKSQKNDKLSNIISVIDECESILDGLFQVP